MTLYSEEEFPEGKSGEDEWIGQPIKTNVHKETNILDWAVCQLKSHKEVESKDNFISQLVSIMYLVVLGNNSK